MIRVGAVGTVGTVGRVGAVGTVGTVGRIGEVGRVGAVGTCGSKRHKPTSGGAVTVVSSCCANCVEPPRPQQWGPDLPFFGHAGHADPLDGWRCCSQKRVMSRPIQVRQL